MAGRREDLKAIWDNVSSWDVGHNNEYVLEFISEYIGGGGWEDWEGEEGHRRGLRTVIDLPEEEWLEELEKFGQTVEEDSGEENSEDSDEENEMGDEEGEDP